MSRLIPTRWSHLLGYSGVGALVRADHDLYVVKDIGHWTDSSGNPAGEPIHYVDLLRATLAIDRELRQPPIARELGNGVVDGTCVPAWRFPGWTRCPSCGLLHWLPWRRGQATKTDSDPSRCSCDRGPRLQQVDWVVAHPEGGLAEVPWHFLAHKDDRAAQDCRRSAERPYLRLTRDRRTGLHWKLSCDRCAERGQPVVTPFEPQQPLAGIDPRRQPWQEWSQSPVVEEPQKARILEVNDARVYFPRLSAALVIPPESRIRRGSLLDLLYCSRADRSELERCRSRLARQGVVRRLADRYACSVGDVESAWNEIENGWPLYGEAASPGTMLSKEFQALIEPIPDLGDGEDFVTRHTTDAWRALTLAKGAESPAPGILSAVDRLVAVSRLREVRIFTGFTRVTQNFDDGLRPTTPKAPSDGQPIARLVPPDLDGSKHWLPAIELYGEGIFFTLNENLLRRWVQQSGLTRRAAILQQRLERTGMRFQDEPPLPLTPRFILLHTLAHLLIRQLETRAGYSAASIRERLYCADGPEPMAGILVYVAVPDLVGSLGGLAELAEPERFLPLLTSVFEHADWCSLDPVCAEHQGQGPSQLNLAACHACALLPEPSCAFGNVLLDRTFVRGDLHGDVQGLLDFAGAG